MNAKINCSPEKLRTIEKLYNDGDLILAEKTIIKLIKLYKKDVNLLNFLGAISLAQNKLKKSIESYKKALKLNPNFIAANYNLANAYREVGLYSKSIKLYTSTNISF